MGGKCAAITIGHETNLQIDEEFKGTSWRAMIIKDDHGDWGICAAAWKGMTSGVPGVPGRPGHRGKPLGSW